MELITYFFVPSVLKGLFHMIETLPGDLAGPVYMIQKESDEAFLLSAELFEVTDIVDFQESGFIVTLLPPQPAAAIRRIRPQTSISMA